MDITYRPRRLRRSPALRAMVVKTGLQASDFIYPSLCMRARMCSQSVPCRVPTAGAWINSPAK